MTPYKEPEKNRREFERVTVNFLVLFRIDRPLYVRMLVGKEEVDAIMVDLSEMGMALLTNYNIPQNTLLSIKFTLINESLSKEERVRQMQIMGEVRYNILRENNVYRLGVLFTEINPDDKRAIVRFVRDTRKNEPA